MLPKFAARLHCCVIINFFIPFIILITFASLPAESVAQSAIVNKRDSSARHVKGKFEIGLSGGFSLNRFTKEQPQTGFSTGYTGGISISHSLYKGLGLQIEANYLQQGGQMISFKDDTRLGLAESFYTKNVKNSSLALNSIEVPLLLNYTFHTKQTWIPAIYAGASYAYTFNATEKYHKTGNLLPGENIIATVTDRQNVTSQYDRNRVNIIGGANVKLPLSAKLKLLLDFRYLTGLTPARENYSYIEKLGFAGDLRSNSFLSKVGVIMSL